MCTRRYVCVCVYVCVNVGMFSPPPSALSATRMSVFHMYVSSDHSVKHGWREEEEEEEEGVEAHSHLHQSMGD